MATSMTNVPFERILMEQLDKAIKETIGAAFDEALEKAYEEAKKKRDDVIAKTSLRIASHYSVENLGHQLRIVVDKELKS